MRSLVARHRLVRAAAAAASVALIAACGPQRPEPQATPSLIPTTPASPGVESPKIAYAPGTLLISDGTDVVTVGTTRVSFPTTVTDASWSPDGSRIAFVDKENNISTSRPDGTGRIVLTKQKAGLLRARPVWQGTDIYFDQRAGSAEWTMRGVHANGANRPDGVGAGDDDFEVFLIANAPGSGTDSHVASAGASGRIAGKEVAFQHTGAGVAEVWVADLYGREPYGTKVADGTEPALSRDGMKIAFVAPDGQVVVASATDAKAKPVQVTFGAAQPSHLAWSPDGTRIAFETARGVESVAASVRAGATSNPSTQLAATRGVPTFLAPARDRVSRIHGSDPISAAIAASQATFPTVSEYFQGEGRGNAANAIIVNAADPIAAVPAVLTAGAYGPLLFTGGASLDPRTRAELKRIFGTNTGPSDAGPTVILIGSTSVISASVETAIRAMGYQTARKEGTDLASIGVAAARGGFSEPVDNVLVASADRLDSLALATMAAGSSTVLFGVTGASLSDGQAAYLASLPGTSKVYAMDPAAQAALAKPWPGKRSGFVAEPALDRAAFLERWGAYVGHLVVTDASSPGDVLIGIGLAVRSGDPAVVVDKSGSVDPGILAFLEHSAPTIDQTLIVDSVNGVAPDVERVLGRSVSGPLGYVTGPPAKPTAR